LLSNPSSSKTTSRTTTPPQQFNLAALGGVVEQPASTPQKFNLEALGGVVEGTQQGLQGGGQAGAQPQNQESLATRGARAVARTAKSLGSGVVGGLADTVTMPYNLAATMFNALKESKLAKDLDPSSRAMLEAEGFYLSEPGSPDIPTAPSAVDAVDRGVDSITGDYTKTPEDEKSLHEGLKAVGSLASAGSAAKGAVKFGANRIGKTLEKLGSTKARDLAAGGIASGVTSEALEKGQGMPAAFGEGIGAGMLANVLLNKKTLNIPAKAAMKTLGLDPKNLKTDTLEAAKRIGVDLPASGATDAKMMGLANQMVAATPVMGDVVRDKVKTASKQFQTAFKELADSVGPIKNEAVDQEINRLYGKVRDTLPKDAAIIPTHTVTAINAVKAKVNTAILSPSEKELLATLDTLGNNLMFDSKLAVPMPVEMLVGTKRSLNSIIKWDKDEGTKNLLRTVQQATLKDIDAYGKTNPTWQKTFDAAERQFEKVAKREKLDNLLAGRIEDPITKDVAYVPLVKLLNDKKYAKQLETTLGNQNFKKLKDFTTVAESMAVANKNTPNPSGSAIVGSVAALVTSIVVGDFTTPLKVIGGGAVLTQLLTNKRFLNLATKFAKQPTESLAQKLNSLIKESTGMTSQALMTGLKEKSQTSD
jgi:hypothetical protein